MLIRRRNPKSPAPPQMIGLDASLNSTGYAFYDANGVLITDRITPGAKKGAARLHHNLTQLKALLDRAKPAIAVVEGYAMNAKGMPYQIGEWGGVLRLELWRRGIDVIVIAPNTLKYAATRSGGAKKPEMIAACKELFGETIDQDDEADAFLLLKAGQAYLYTVGPKDFVHRVLNPQNPKKPGYSVDKGARLAV